MKQRGCRVWAEEWHDLFLCHGRSSPAAVLRIDWGDRRDSDHSGGTAATQGRRREACVTEVGEKSESWHILKTELTELADRLHVGMRDKRS